MSQPSRILLTLRFLVGVSMVAGGAALAAPFLVTVAAALGRQEPALSPAGDTMVRHPYAAAPAGWAAAPVLPVDPGFGPGTAPAVGGFSSAAAVVSIPVGHAGTAPLQPDPVAAPSQPVADPFMPPTPPPPLPRVPLELMGSGPEFTGTYRSTLDLPPPPLLDGHESPPTQVAWSVRPPAVPRQPELQTIPAALVPPTYVVRDGDDLTSIATRFYGHPAAAGAVWTANRMILDDPEVLPIGSTLTLPPPWTIAAARPGAGSGPGPIDPRPASAAAPRAPAAPAPTASILQASWLGDAPRGSGGLATTQPVTFTAVSPAGGAAVKPGSVRVAAGETLDTLAMRFYGDPAMSRRIWEVNRDRLRSPALVVPGMELRLP